MHSPKKGLGPRTANYSNNQNTIYAWWVKTRRTPFWADTKAGTEKPCPKRVLPPYPHLSANRPDLTFGFPLWVHVVSWPPKAITFYFWVHAMQVRFGTYGRVFFEGASFFWLCAFCFSTETQDKGRCGILGSPKKDELCTQS